MKLSSHWIPFQWCCWDPTWCPPLAPTAGCHEEWPLLCSLSLFPFICPRCSLPASTWESLISFWGVHLSATKRKCFAWFPNSFVSLKQVISFEMHYSVLNSPSISLRDTEEDNLLPFIKITSLFITYTPTAVIKQILFYPLPNYFFLDVTELQLCCNLLCVFLMPPSPKLILQFVFSGTFPPLICKSQSTQILPLFFFLWYLLCLAPNKQNVNKTSNHHSNDVFKFNLKFV